MTIKTVFQELRSKGHIRKSKRCRWSPLVFNFKAGVLFRRTIFYDKKYDNLDEDLLRFALLHEEGHHQGKQYTPLVLIMDVIVVVSSVLLVDWKARVDNDIVQPIVWGLMPIYIWLILASLKVFGKYIHEDEFRSDSFAARILRDSYGISKPSETIDRMWKALTPSKKHDSIGYRLFRLLLGGLHPSDEERVRKIADTIDNR
jgi:Zn-dependent protease with chaperone function